MLRYDRFLWILILVVGAAPVVRADDPKPKDGDKKEAKKDADTNGKDQDKDKDEKKKKKKDDRYFAVQGGTVHTVTGGTLLDVTILTKNGKIIDIGESVELPEKCETLDAAGFHIYPGLVAVSSSGVIGSEPPDDTTNVFSLPLTIGLAGGITTAVSGNTAGKLTFATLEDLVIKRDLFHKIDYSHSNPNGKRKLREKFEKVRQYMRDLDAYTIEKKKNKDAEEPDKEWLTGDYEKIYDLMRGKLVAVASADLAYDIIQYCELAERYGFKLVLRGAMEGWTVPSRMARAGVSVILSIRPQMFTTSSGHDDRLNRKTGRSIENAAILAQHGVPVAIVPTSSSITLWGLAGRDLLHLNMEAAFAVRGGLSEELALRAITIDAARVLGVDHRVGSIEVGKDADFVIADGDLLHYMTHARWTVVNGRIAYDKQKESLYDHIRPDGKLDAPPPDDHWPRRLGAN